MKTYTKTTVTKEPRLVIRYEEDSESPRSWSNLGYFITVDRDYHSPDKHEELESIIKSTGDEAEDQDDHIKRIKDEFNQALPQDEKIIAIYPVVKYEHSGVCYSLGTKHNFDYSNNGFYIVTDKTQKELGTAKKDFEQTIKNELETYNSYFNGEVYYFTLYDRKGEMIESCGGYYKIDQIRAELPKEWENADLDEYLIHN